MLDSDIRPDRLRQLLTSAGVTIEPLLADDAELAGALRSLPGGRHCHWAIDAAWL